MVCKNIEGDPSGSGSATLYSTGDLLGRRCRCRGVPSPPSPGTPWPSAAFARSPAHNTKIARTAFYLDQV